MIVVFVFLLALVSNGAVEAAHKAPSIFQDHKEVVLEACLCPDCDPWWIPNFLITARPHPLSPAEESAAQALYALPMASVSSADSNLPLLNLILEWVGEDFGTDKKKQEKQWLLKATYKDVVNLNLNSCKRPDLVSHGNSYGTDAIFFGETRILPEDVIFDDGKCQGYFALNHRWIVDIDLQVISEKDHDYSHLKWVKAVNFEKVSVCGKHKVIVFNEGKYNGRNRALTVMTYYGLDPLFQRLIARIKSINGEPQKK